ncbi:MAG: hypothetical protein ACKOCN_06235 [Planctomycetaceae bacterium]
MTMQQPPFHPFDVITVPDFSSEPAVFEARAIVFLATWLESGGPSWGCPLHVACIGEPPPSVRRMAGACGASVTVHEPVRLRQDHHVGNKLRGLEISPRTDRFLLLDCDIGVLSDVSSLSGLGRCIAAAPDDAPNVAEADWHVVYEAFDLPMPLPIRPLVCELDLPRYPPRTMGFEAGDGQIEWMLPYYNGGVVFAPWDSGLRGLWEHNILRIAALFEDGGSPRRWVHHSDQAALAVSIAMLQRDGMPVRRLPDAFNTRWQHLNAGQPETDDIAVMHCCWNFLSSIGEGPLTPTVLDEAIQYFFDSKVRHRFWKLVVGDLLRFRPFVAQTRYWGGLERVATVRDKILEACRRHASTAIEPPATPRIRAA